MCHDSRQGCVPVELSLYLPPQSCWAVGPRNANAGRENEATGGIGRNLKLRPTERELVWQAHSLFLTQECRRWWSLSRNIFNSEQEIMQTSKACCHSITVSRYSRLPSHFGPSTVCLEILLHLCTQEVCLPFVWETSHNLSRKRMRRCWLSDAHFHLDDLNTILTWKSGQGFTLQIP